MIASPSIKQLDTLASAQDHKNQCESGIVHSFSWIIKIATLYLMYHYRCIPVVFIYLHLLVMQTDRPLSMHT